MRKQSILTPERLVAFTDAVIAIAITLLVLDVRVPDGLPRDQLVSALGDTVPHLSAYALSFFIIGVYWLAHHRMFARIVRVDGVLLRRNLAFLFCIALLPFPTTLIAEYGPEPAAVISYALTVAATGLCSTLMLHRSIVANLQEPPLTAEERSVAMGRALTPPLVMLGSVLVALVSPELAMYSWILIAFLQPRQKEVA